MDKAAGFRTKTGELVTMSYFSANIMGTEAAGFVGHTHFRHPLSPGNRALSSFGKPLPYFPLHTSFLDKFKDEAHGPHQVPQSFSLEISQLGVGVLAAVFLIICESSSTKQRPKGTSRNE